MIAPSVPIRHKCGHTEGWCIDRTTAAGQDAVRTLEQELCAACLWPLELDYVDYVGTLPMDAPRVPVGDRVYTWEALD